MACPVTGPSDHLPGEGPSEVRALNSRASGLNLCLNPGSAPERQTCGEWADFSGTHLPTCALTPASGADGEHRSGRAGSATAGPGTAGTARARLSSPGEKLVKNERRSGGLSLGPSASPRSVCQKLRGGIGQELNLIQPVMCHCCPVHPHLSCCVPGGAGQAPACLLRPCPHVHTALFQAACGPGVDGRQAPCPCLVLQVLSTRPARASRFFPGPPTSS